MTSKRLPLTPPARRTRPSRHAQTRPPAQPVAEADALAPVPTDLAALKNRLQYLEESNRWHVFALDQVASLAHLHGGGAGPIEANAILSETRLALQRIMAFQAMAFFLVGEEDPEFRLALCHPPSMTRQIKAVTDQLIEHGEFAWALQQNRPVAVNAPPGKDAPVLLHAILTPHTVLGMFVGLMSHDQYRIASSRLNLAAILLHQCAFALESSAWRHRLQQANRDLEARVESSLSHIRAQNQELLHKVAALKQAEEALTVAKSAAEAANIAKSEFLATMSHEIRTPLNAILGMAQILAETTLSPDQKRYVEVFQQAGKVLLVLINDILDLSRIEAGKLELTRSPINLPALVEETVTLFELPAREKGLTLEVNFASGLPQHLISDPHRLRQVLVNLLQNAVKFTDHGVVRLEAAPAEEGHAIRFTIRDTGIGIPTNKLDQVFQRFTQVDASSTRRHGGSGLGLTISQHLVKHMGGRIWVESQVGAGSAFHFTLPNTPAAVSLSGATLPTDESTASAQILLITPASHATDPLCNPLVEAGHTVTLAHDGQAATELLQQAPFDLLLVATPADPQWGTATLTALRVWEQRQQRPPLPLLVVTDATSQPERQALLAAGASDLLMQPVRRGVLLKSVARLAKTAEHRAPP